MASSTSRTPEPWIPGLPDNEIEVGQTLRAYQEAIAEVGRTKGIEGLMEELTRINAAIQAQGQAALAQAVTSRLERTLGSLDSMTVRLRPATSPDSERGRAVGSSPTFHPPSSPGRRPGGLGPSAAARIAAAQRRATERRAMERAERAASGE